MSGAPTHKPCCAIGARADAAAIDAALRAGGLENSVRKVAERFDLGRTAVSEHRACLGLRAEVRTAARTPERTGSDSGPDAADTSLTSGSPFAIPNPKDDPTTAPRKVIAATIEGQAVALRARGKSYVAIAAELGVDPDTAMDAVERVLLRTRRGADEKADAARRLDLERVDQLLAGLWDRATDPAMATVEVPADTETGVRAYDGQDKAVDRVTKLLERRAKLLGLDVPTVGTQINFYGSPDWQRIRDVILAALMPYPDALAAVISAMERSMRGGPDGGESALAA